MPPCGSRCWYSNMNSGSVSFSSTLAKVNSPSTTAKVRNDDEMIAVRRFGIRARRSVVPQPAPRLREASTSVLTSIARTPASIARNVNGSASTV